MKYCQILAAVVTSLLFAACATTGRDATSVRVLQPSATVPDSCQAVGEVSATGFRLAGISPLEAVRIDLRQNAFYRFQADKVRIVRTEVAPGGLIAQGTAYKCPADPVDK